MDPYEEINFTLGCFSSLEVIKSMKNIVTYLREISHKDVYKQALYQISSFIVILILDHQFLCHSC